MTDALELARKVSHINPRVIRLKRPSYKYREKKKQLEDYTEKVLKTLKRPLEPGLTEYLSLVVIGTMGYGKTKLVDWFVKLLKEYYGKDQVNAIMHKGGNLEALLENLDSKPVQILFLDDSFGKMSKTALTEFFLVRHKHKAVRAAEGLEEMGLIIGFFGIQNLYSLDESARRVSDFMIAKSSTGDKWYRNDMSKSFGEEGLKELDKVTHEVLFNKNQEAKSTCVVRITGEENTGIIKTGLVESQFIEVEEKPELNLPDYGDSIELTRSGVHEVEYLGEEFDIQFGADVIMSLMGKVNPRDLAVFTRHVDGESARTISAAKTIDVKARRVNQIIADIKKNHIGYAAENVLHRRHPRWEHGGENTDAPDFIDHDGARVISLKCYADTELTPGSGKWLTERVGKKEFESAAAFDYELELWVFEMFRRSWLRWRVNLPNPSPAPENPEPETKKNTEPEAEKTDNPEPQTKPDDD